MRTRPLCFVCFCFLAIQSIVFLLVGGKSLKEIPASSVFRQQEEVSVMVEGQIYKKTNTSNSQILYLKNNSIKFQNQVFYDSKLVVYMKDEAQYPIGKTIAFRGTTILFEKARNPGNFDQFLYYAKQGIYGAIWCEQVQNVTGERKELSECLYQFKQRWKENILSIIGEKQGAVLTAMLLGEKGEMDTEIRELYQVGGIGHILAISGLHISFIGLGIYKLSRRIGLGYGLSGIFAISVLSLYVVMIGGTVSVIRAFVMLLLRIGADVSGRVYDILTALSLAAALTIGVNPAYFIDAGFYMSYGAILGLVLLQPMMERVFLCKRKWASGIYASMAINVMLFPITLWFYFEFPIYSMLLNLAVIPLTGVVIGFGMIGSFLLLLIEPVGRLCLQISAWTLELIESIARLGSKLPISRLVIGKPRMWEVIVYYIALCILVWLIHRFPKQGQMRKWKICGLLACAMAVFLLTYRSVNGLCVTMLDVGQGDGMFVRGPSGMACFIDGGSSDVEAVGRYRIEPYLKSQGVGTLNYVFITHGDGDHYNGIKEMLERQDVGIQIENLVLPATFRQDEVLVEMAKIGTAAGTKVYTIDTGEKLKEKHLRISCIQPSGKDTTLEGNAGSMVLEISYKDFFMLCTGDVEGKGEESLITKIRNKEYDVLKVSHHGSANATSQQLLEEASPKIALISAGKDNVYGHPHPETMSRLKSAGCQIFETSKTGAITLKTEGKNLQLFTVFH